MRCLILGGTAEASALAARLAGRPDVSVMLSLAGRTSEPRTAPVPTRVGGFGGVDGLVDWLRVDATETVVDATHPFAAVISRNAAAACGSLGVPLLALRRPGWRPVAGDRWIEIDTVAAAADALGATPRRVFLTVGRLELAAFARASWHSYLVRTIEPIGGALPVPNVTAVQARGPFDEAEERALMERERIEVLVTKNSGGAATFGKIAAARALALSVIMVRQPEKPKVACVETVTEAVAWVEAHAGAPQLRGVST
jgi:precorrin-6A/cobalt-precorrin-6A reductase